MPAIFEAKGTRFVGSANVGGGDESISKSEPAAGDCVDVSKWGEAGAEVSSIDSAISSDDKKGRGSEA